MEEISYKTQRAFVRCQLIFRPALTDDQIKEIYFIAFGQVLTWTPISQAREDLGLKEGSKENLKYTYFQALFSQNPDLEHRVAVALGEKHFQEFTRDDVIERQREYAKKDPFLPVEADLIIRSVEAHSLSPQKTLGF